MFEGVKFMPRDQINKDDSSDDLEKGRKKSRRREEKRKSKTKVSSRYNSSSDEELERVKRSSKKKWYSSEEYSSSSSRDERRRRSSRKKGKRRNDDSSGDESAESDDGAGHHGRGKRVTKGRSKKDKRSTGKKSGGGDVSDHDTAEGSEGDNSLKEKEIVRKEMGLEWMLRPEAKREEIRAEIEPEATKNEEVKKVNPKELNPYLKDDGSGYPEENDAAGSSQLLSSSLVGDGGASWRLKALKRAQEQAAREGRKLEEVVEERWGSVGQLAVSVSSHRAAPARAHLRAINNRKRGATEENESGSGSQKHRYTEKNMGRDYLKDISVKVPKMKEPKARDSLSWGAKRGSQLISNQDAHLVSAAVSSINKFSNDGSFMREVLEKKNDKPRSPARENAVSEPESLLPVNEHLSANQLAAKALQLRLKGKHEEAERLMQQVENIRPNQDRVDNQVIPRREEGSSRHVTRDIALRRKKNEDDGDIHLAQKIAQNRRFSVSGQADDEYDFDDCPSRKSKKKRGHDQAGERNTSVNRFSAKQEECIFCFESRKRPTHLVVAVANFTYLKLPQREPVVPGHCCILPMQHAPSMRTVDDYVWEEIRNFKKCLIMMFGKQEKDVVFLETAMGLAKQRRHCIIECIPLPREIAEEAPHYFKTEIEEAESEWSQHNAKKLIRTDVKGLRGSIPENIPYFHVEFGLKSGFLHPIDDEREFTGSFGLNVIRGIMKLPEEDMYRRQRNVSTEEQKEAVHSFARDWAPFDWTKQLREEES